MTRATYHLDSNHLGVRLTVLVAMLVGFFGGIFAIPALLRLLRIQGGGWSLLSILGGLALAFGLSWLVEMLLRRVWRSGRVLEIDAEHITLREPNGQSLHLTCGEPVAVWAWCFVISDRRAWVPRGWYCVALRLAQDDRVIIPYTFVSPNDAKALPSWQVFEELISERLASRPGQEHLAQFLGEQEHLRAAESERWLSGAEMQPQDFAALIRVLEARLPNWPRGRAA